MIELISAANIDKKFETIVSFSEKYVSNQEKCNSEREKDTKVPDPFVSLYLISSSLCIC